MKKKFFRLSAAGLLFFSGIMEIGWRFFNMVVCCKRGGRKKERKKWFELSHIRDNHPRNGYAKEYDESRAWVRGSEDAGLLYPERGWIKTPRILSTGRECKALCYLKPWLQGQQIWIPVIYGKISPRASV